jgi:hypothetical protein
MVIGSRTANLWQSVVIRPPRPISKNGIAWRGILFINLADYADFEDERPSRLAVFSVGGVWRSAAAASSPA